MSRKGSDGKGSRILTILWTGRYAIPSTFTFLSIACAVLSMMGGDLPVGPAWLIMYSVLLDKLDGTAARLLRAQTRFGVQLDSFADLLAFGFAPAVLYYRLATQGPIGFPGSEALFGFIAVLYALATARRLHRFNSEVSGSQSKSFRGMPSTLAGGLFASFVVAFMPDAGVRAHLALTIGLLALAVAMNARYRTRKVSIPRNRILLVLQSAFALFLYGATFTRSFPQLLFGAALLALVISVTGVPRDVPTEEAQGPQTAAGPKGTA